MKKRVYIETSVISYLTARPSWDIVSATRQATTEQWWREHLPPCEALSRARGVKFDDPPKRKTTRSKAAS